MPERAARISDHHRLGSTFSVFRIEQPSGFTDASTNVFSVNGEQRNTGFEWSIFGAATANTRILGGLMWLDGELTKTANGEFDGSIAVGVARINANLGGEWDTPFLPGMTLTARVIYTGDQYVNQANTQEIPDWTRMDIGARYVFETGGDTIGSWLFALHMAAIWGLPFKVFVGMAGLVVAMLSVTGMVIWARKRSARAKSGSLRRPALVRGSGSGVSCSGTELPPFSRRSS